MESVDPAQTLSEPSEVERLAPKLTGSVFTTETFRGRPNAVRGATVTQQAQQSHGNQAVQRALAEVSSMQRDSPAAAPPVTDAEAETKMSAALQKSALGQSALAIKAKYLVTLVRTDSGAAGFEDNGNRCRINRNLDPTEAAGYFTHEMHHAEERISGRS